MVKKAFKNALLVQLISGIVGIIGMVVDGAVTGRCLGTGFMTGYGLSTPVVTVFIACSGVCGLGSSILIGRLVGARKTKEASGALSACLLFALAFSLVLTAAVFRFAPQIAAFLGAKGTVAGMAADYLRGFSLCAPALLILTVLMPVMEINGRRGRVLAAVVVMTVVNIAGDLLVGLVFRQTGLFGMALATSVSYFAALALVLPVLFKKDSAVVFTFKGLSFAPIGEMLTGGLPSALQQICRSLLILILNRELLRIADENAVAVFTAIMTAANLCMALGSGIGSSVSMLTGVFAGDGDDRAIRELVFTALRKAVLYDAVLCAALFALAGVLMPLFIADKALLSVAVPGFRLYSLSMVGYSVNVTMRLYYQAMRQRVLSYIYVVCNSLVLTALGALVLGRLIGVNGIWLSFLFGETATLALLALRVLLRKKNGAGFWDKLLCIPAELTADVLDRYDGSASAPEQMARVSEQVHGFCAKNGADARTAYVLSLATEELGEYILAHNAPTGKKETVEVRVLCKADSWTLRLRDNGSRFDPLTVLGSGKKDDFSYIGVKLITDMVRNVEYLDTLNINNLNIEIKR